MSQPTTCAEEDNVNVPIYDSKVKVYQVTATHPTYDIGQDNCDPDFSGCNGAAAAGRDPDVCTPLWDDGINAIHVCTVAEWWRGLEMNVGVGQQTLTGHYLQWYRKIFDEASWPQVLALYQDGNMRLKPHPPPGRTDVCFGSSVIVGPAAPAERPYVDVEDVTIDPAALALDVSYLNDESAHLSLAVDRSKATVDVTVGYDVAGGPAAIFRSMWVSDGNADVDHAEAKAGDLPILGDWTSLAGPWWFFHRDVISTHDTSAPDIRIEILAENPNAIGGVAELPGVEGAPRETGGSSGPRAGVVAGIAGIGAVCALALGGAAWFARRRQAM